MKAVDSDVMKLSVQFGHLCLANLRTLVLSTSRIAWHAHPHKACNPCTGTPTDSANLWGTLQLTRLDVGHSAMHQQGTQHVAAKEVLQEPFHVFRAEQVVDKFDELWLAGAVLNQALQDTTAIDVNRHGDRMVLELLDEEDPHARLQELNTLLQDEVGV